MEVIDKQYMNHHKAVIDLHITDHPVVAEDVNVVYCKWLKVVV